MCGIGGIIDDKTLNEIEDVLAYMKQALQHRGPDHSELHQFENGGFIHTRLSIIDPSPTSHQPFKSSDGRYILTYNGELYNFKALRKDLSKDYTFVTQSDTEVVLAAYIKWKENCLTHFNGMFAFSIYDCHEKKLFAARDRLGIKPFYYHHHLNTFLFASEFKAIANSPGFEKQLNLEAVNYYLTLDYVPAPLSIDHRISKLEAGHYLIFQDSKLQCIQYWDITHKKKVDHLSLNEYVEQFDSLLNESIQSRLMSDVPLGVFLSGGLDSSMVSAIAKQYKPDLKTFSIHFNEKSYDESHYSQQASNHIQTDHTSALFSYETLCDQFETVLKDMNEPFADASFFPTSYLSQITKQHVSVALGGDGSDELFAGYPTMLAHKANRLMPLFKTRILKLLYPYIPTRHTNFSLKFKVGQFLKGCGHSNPIQHMYWMGAFNDKEKEHLLDNAKQYSRNLENNIENQYNQYDDTDWLNRILYLDTKNYLCHDILYKTDQASMYHALEVRVPFLDHRIVEWAFGLPSNLKLKGLTSKFILKKLASKYLPQSIINRPKKGFGIPLSEWMQGPLKTKIKETLSETTGFSYFNSNQVMNLFNTYQQGQDSNHKLIWSLFILKQWCLDNEYSL